MKISHQQPTHYSKMQSQTNSSFVILLFFVEMWERFSYYGMRALLVLFLISHLGFDDAKAYSVYSLFVATGYAVPVFSGFLADKLMGFKNMVLIGGVVTIIGYIVLSMFNLNDEFVYLGLGLIAIGKGLFKGNITSLLGSCYAEKDHDRDRGFTLFYVGINIGAFMASITCGYTAYLYGWCYGFALAGLGMAIGLTVFVRYQHTLGEHGNSPRPDLMNKRIFGLTPCVLILLTTVFFGYLFSIMLMNSEIYTKILIVIGVIMLCIFSNVVLKLSAAERTNMVALSVMTFFLMCFFSLEMHLGSLINLFTERNVDSEIFGITIPTSVSQGLNPVSVIIFGLAIAHYYKSKRKTNIFKWIIGPLSLVICFMILYLGCLNANIYGKVDYMIAMAIGEICIMPTVQAQATILAPLSIRGFTMGILMLTLAFSNLLGIVLAKFMSVPSIGGVVNIMESLEIYRDGFLYIAVVTLGILAIFLLFLPFLHRVMTHKKHT